MSGPVGVLLAAGSARRFGSHKLLQTLPDGRPLAVAAAQALIDALPRSIAVIRAGDDELRAVLCDLGLDVIENAAAERGMGNSLACGVRHTGDADGWLIALADMPWVEPATICAIADGLRQGGSIVAPRWRGRRGNPVGFAACWVDQLTAVDGDRGARHLLDRYGDQVTYLECDDAGILHDVDRPADMGVFGMR